MPDSVSPDTDFAAALETLGWHTVFALRYDERTPALLARVAQHRPDYTPLYTFSKYLLEGARLRYRARAARASGAERYPSMSLIRKGEALWSNGSP